MKSKRDGDLPTWSRSNHSIAWVSEKTPVVNLDDHLLDIVVVSIARCFEIGCDNKAQLSRPVIDLEYRLVFTAGDCKSRRVLRVKINRGHRGYRGHTFKNFEFGSLATAVRRDEWTSILEPVVEQVVLLPEGKPSDAVDLHRAMRIGKDGVPGRLAPRRERIKAFEPERIFDRTEATDLVVPLRAVITEHKHIRARARASVEDIVAVITEAEVFPAPAGNLVVPGLASQDIVPAAPPMMSSPSPP